MLLHILLWLQFVTVLVFLIVQPPYTHSSTFVCFWGHLLSLMVSVVSRVAIIG